MEKHFPRSQNAIDKAETRRERVLAKREAHFSKVQKTLEKNAIRDKKTQRAKQKTVKRIGGRSMFRLEKGIKAKSVRKRSTPLSEFIPNRNIKMPEGLTLHDGTHEQGLWQLEFLKSQGLLSSHTIADIGCGDLLEGVPLIRYLEPNRYIGIDQNPMVINQGCCSLKEDDWEKNPRFFLGGDFGFELVDIALDYAWANSVFSHIDLNLAAKCMWSIYQRLNPGGIFMATFFKFNGEPKEAWASAVPYRAVKGNGEDSGGKSTYGFRNPFHYAPGLLCLIAGEIGYETEVLTPNHPKRQAVLKMRRPA